VLTTQVSVTSGSAQTVAGVGRHAELGLRVLHDDLSLPKGNKSKVRIVQASIQAPVLGVSLTNGPSIAENVAFATTTEYFIVDPGSWQLQIRPATGGQSTNVSATLGSGNVYSLLVIDAGQGTLKTQLFTDAAKGRGLPWGGVATGGGGTSSTGNTTTYVIAGAGLLLLVLVAGLVMGLRRRRTTL
jgi:LPXTG-motif cell wall-anchored protein